MKTFRINKWCMVTALVAVGTTIGLTQHIAAQQLPPPEQPQRPKALAAVQDGVEVLTRGPVHEAFAETITFDPEPGIVAPQAPPEAIEEVPPQQRPAGKNVAWIPGYWAWDDERNDFLWLSGIWRRLCRQVRQWVPGYWGRSQQGAQWTSGYWADANVTEIQYLPEPPATVEEGPSIAAPSPDQHWLPGCWVWQQNRYAWRRILGGRQSRLGLGARPLRVDTQRLCIRGRLLRLLGPAPRCRCLRRSIFKGGSAPRAVSPIHLRR